MKRVAQLLISGVAGLLLVTGCTPQKSQLSLTPQVSTVVGQAKLMREGQKAVDLKPGIVLREGDQIEVGDQSKVKLLAGPDNDIFILGVSRFTVKELKGTEQGGSSLRLMLIVGEVFASFSKLTGSNSFSVSTPTATASIRGTDFNVVYSEETGMAEVKVVEGTVEVVADALNTAVPVIAGTKIAISQTAISTAVPMTTEDKDHIKSWVNDEKIAATISNQGQSGPATDQTESQNLPPAFTSSPRSECLQDVAFTDTIKAEDPENAPLTYLIKQAPKGFVINPKTGVITYMPVAPGAFDVVIEATDDKNAAVEMTYTLKVVNNVLARLTLPSSALPKETVAIDALQSRSGAGSAKKMGYRFDINGDGVWDYPAGRDFGPEARMTHTFDKEGSYNVSVEVKNEMGQTARTVRKILINTPPVAHLAISPALGTQATEFTLSAAKSSDTRDSEAQLVARWDFDGNGTWDSPENGQFTEAKTIKHRFANASGPVRCMVQVKDRDGAMATDTASVLISQGVSISKIDAPDTAHIGETVTVTCSATDPQFAIAGYAWKFSADEAFSSAKDVATTSHIFKTSGQQQITCKVINEKDQSASASRPIVIINAKASISAKGPYVVGVNSPLTVAGTASDADSKIKQYAWDFTNDGTFEVASDTASKAHYTYPKSGVYTLVFKVTTDDGNITTDTTTVTVGNKPPMAQAGVDILSYEGDKVKLMGKGTDQDGAIAKYEWDFNGDGTFDWSSPTTGIVKQKFDKYCFPVLRVTDSDGATALDTVRIVICPDGMITIEKQKFCIDRYEFPNVKREYPKRDISFVEAQKQCMAQGKRLCSAQEWTYACNGGSKKKRPVYPYGSSFITESCNSLGNTYIGNKIAKTATFPQCVSPFGVYDMSGNVAEWTTGADGKSAEAFGGSWQNGAKGSTCSSKLNLDKEKNYFYVGFRCCK